MTVQFNPYNAANSSYGSLNPVSVYDKKLNNIGYALAKTVAAVADIAKALIPVAVSCVVCMVAKAVFKPDAVLERQTEQLAVITAVAAVISFKVGKLAHDAADWCIPKTNQLPSAD